MTHRRGAGCGNPLDRDHQAVLSDLTQLHNPPTPATTSDVPLTTSPTTELDRFARAGD